MTGGDVRIGECLSIFQGGETRIIVVVSILLRVMSPHPSTDFEETNVGILRLFLDSINVGCVQLLSVQETSLLKDGDPLKPVWVISAKGPVRVCGIHLPEFIVDFHRNLDILLTS